MEAEGVNITQGLTPSNFVSTMRVAFITDPWGTKMEITEGIAPWSTAPSEVASFAALHS